MTYRIFRNHLPVGLDGYHLFSDGSHQLSESHHHCVAVLARSVLPPNPGD